VERKTTHLKEEPMNFVQLSRKYYCGIDLHSKSMILCVVAADGKILMTKHIMNCIAEVLKALKPFARSLVIGVESTFNWYWLVDGCREHGLEIYLGHTPYMKIISTSKNKNDRIDAKKIANLLRAGLFPKAHAVEAKRRAIRDLLRHRNWLVSMRSELFVKTKTTFYQQGDLASAALRLRYRKTRESAVSGINDEHIRLSATSNMEIAASLDKQIKTIEAQLELSSTENYSDELNILMSIPGVGPIIGMTIMYETDTICRFKRRQHYSSYCRLVRPEHTSDGKIVGMGNAKCGSAYLKWAYMEIISNAANSCAPLKVIYDLLKDRYQPLKARAIMANKFCAAVYYMLKHKKKFDVNRFCKEPILAVA
jgi:transposase